MIEKCRSCLRCGDPVSSLTVAGGLEMRAPKP